MSEEIRKIQGEDEAIVEDGEIIIEDNSSEKKTEEEGLFDFLQRMRNAIPMDEADDGVDDVDDEDLVADDYHNKATEFANKGKNKRAAEICIEGLKRFDGNIDLLADVVKYSADSGNVNQAQTYFEMLIKLPRPSFNWRAYTFVLDFLMDDLTKNESLCRELISDYKKYIPYEEKAYVAESELEAKLGNHNKSQVILEEAIKSMRNAPQSALRLADIQLERGFYEEAVNTVNYAMMASAETQPSINTPYLVYVRCLAEDALLHKKAIENGSVGNDEVEYVLSQYEKLKSAFPVIRMRFESVISNRINLLSFVKTE